MDFKKIATILTGVAALADLIGEIFSRISGNPDKDLRRIVEDLRACKR